MRTRPILIAALVIFCAAPARAEEPAAAPAPAPAAAAPDQGTALLLDTIRANRKALVEVNLGLSDEEEAKFWPVYERYQGELAPVQDRLVAVIEDYVKSYRGLSDEKAMTLLDQYLGVEEERAKVRRAYTDDFAAVLPGKKVARFYQIENKMDAVLRYDLAAGIPVVEE
jgi:hypothetical protein